ncbi:hypothetical protein TNCV_2405431 [Trichonephila clavipes]|nr:hypothetical protein TNCV_2405431 [Trichonephila clavipes]
MHDGTAQHFWESDCMEYISLNDVKLLPQSEMSNNQFVRHILDNFTRVRIIGKIEESRSAMDPQFHFLDDNVLAHCTEVVNELLDA